MKRKGFLIIMIFFALGLLLIGCNTKTTPTLSVDSAINLEVGEIKVIEPTIGNTTETLQVLYETDNAAIVSVNNNTITAEAVGVAKITVSLKEYPSVTKQITVTVVKAQPTLTLTGLDTVVVGEDITLVATDVKSTDNKVFWQSLNEEILTVSQTGVVTGVSAGTAKVKISSLITTDFLEKEITVTAADPTLTLTGPETVIIAQSINLVATDSKSTDNVVQWQSSNEAIFTVSQTGVVTGVGLGTATLTISSLISDEILELLITVVAPTLTLTGPETVIIGQSITLVATDSNSANNIVQWESLNTSIFTATNTGVITGVSAGTAILKISSLSSNETLVYTITVVEPTLTLTGLNTLDVGQTITLVATDANSTDNIVQWQSSNDSIFTVNQDGVVTAISGGTAIVTISSLHSNEILEFTITVTAPPLMIIGSDTVYAGQTINLVAVDSNSTDNVVYWESSNNFILTVSQSGVVTGISGGTAIVTIISYVTYESIEKEITVIIPTASSVEIGSIPYDRVTLSTIFRLNAVVLPAGASQEVIWTSSDNSIATIDAIGRITPLKPGEVTMKATANGTTISGEITFLVDPTAMELIASLHNEDPMKKTITIYGWENNGQTFQHNMYVSVNKYLSEPLNIVQRFIPPTLANRPGIIKQSTNYITVHDTGSSGAGAESISNYVVGGGGGTSWHYTIGNDGTFHHMPNNEVAYHAGDGSRQYTLTDTSVPAGRPNPVVSINQSNGYYQIDGIQTTILAPTNNGAIVPTAKINDMGVEIVIGANGNYFMGSTWYSSTYGLIGNAGGNRNSIGIESCINTSSDIYLTWQKLAKLVAFLLEEQNLGMEAVVNHHYFSGKNCPQTMRRAAMWPHFLELVESEVLVRTYLSDHTIEFTSNSPFIDNRGRVINLPVTASRVSYTVKITDSQNVSESRVFWVNLPAK